jgi:ABC-2 type transport system permease protein
MIEDARTVMWKEWKEIWRGGSRTRVFPIIILLIFGAVIVPNALRGGTADWSTVLYLLIWLPFLFSANIIADSVAGERERHTLETLLASRLPDRAIVLGKMSVTVLYAWGMALVGSGLALVVANLRSTTLVLYPADILVGVVGLSLLAAVFVSALGVLVSLKSHTSREAQQIIAISSLVVPFGSLLIVPNLPSGALSFIMSGGLDGVMLVVGVAFLVMDAALTLVAFTQFKRTKLMAHN